MSALIVLLILCIWGALLYNFGYYASFAVKRKWVRQVIGAAVTLGLFTLPINDEIAGAKEFEALCKSGGAYQIAPEAKGKKFDLKYSEIEGRMLKDHSLPIQEYFTKITDASSGQVLATGKTYTLLGGRLVRFLGGNPMGTGNKPLLSESTCAVFNQDNPANSLLRSLSNATTK